MSHTTYVVMKDLKQLLTDSLASIRYNVKPVRLLSISPCEFFPLLLKGKFLDEKVK